MLELPIKISHSSLISTTFKNLYTQKKSFFYLEDYSIHQVEIRVAWIEIEQVCFGWFRWSQFGIKVDSTELVDPKKIKKDKKNLNNKFTVYKV